MTHTGNAGTGGGPAAAVEEGPAGTAVAGVVTAETAHSTGTSPTAFDVVIVGGGAAGLSAAVALGRALRSVAVIDAGEPRNAPAEGVHNFLTRDGINPFELQRMGRAEAESYGGTMIAGTAVAARRTSAGFAVTLGDGTVVSGRRLLVATGLTDELPDVAGLRSRFGGDALHCPYCHGWEVRGTEIGILASGPRAMHQALMFRQWSARITLFLHTAPEPTDEELEQLAARGITVVRGSVAGVVVVDDALIGVRMADGSRHPLDNIVVGPRFVARSEVLESLGIHAEEHPTGAGTFVPSAPGGLTAVPGVWVAGNVADPMAQVVSSAAAGLMAGAGINADLTAADLDDAVRVYRLAGARTAS